MENISKKRLCVMIVGHNLDCGTTRSAHGYQAVLVRSVESAIAVENLSHERVVHGETTAWIG
jgi:hypothetical protein